MVKKTNLFLAVKSLFSSPPEKRSGIYGELVTTFSLDLKIQIFVYFRVSDFSFSCFFFFFP